MRKYLLAWWMFFLSFSPMALWAFFNVDGVSFSYGQGEPAKLRVFLLGIQWNWFSPLYENQDIKVLSFLDMQFGYWTVNAPVAEAKKSLATDSLIPMFRIVKILPDASVDPYVEAGVGVTFASSHTLAGHDLGGVMAFQPKLGCGFLFGTEKQFDLSYHYTAYNNFNLRRHNDGFSANALLTFAYKF